jgi:Zn-dependent protease with chaperone function
MIELTGTYFDGKSSKPFPVSVKFDGARVRFRGINGDLELDFMLQDCKFNPPLGNTRRSMLLPGGGRCETSDLQAFAVLENSKGANRVMRLVNFIETRWRLVTGCLIGLILFVWVFTVYGIPFVAKKVAYTIPTEISEKISQKTLQMFDQRLFEPSELDGQKADKLRKIFKNLKQDVAADFDHRLVFRKSQRIGPNAFALPSGQILITDELVALAKNDQELIGILVHEMSHVEKRHGMRMLFQNAGAFFLISVLVGDVASITSIAGTLPTLLVESGYSRKFEKEADQAAGNYLIRNGFGTEPYCNILLRLSESRSHYNGFSMMASHPATQQRINYLQELEKSLH